MAILMLSTIVYSLNQNQNLKTTDDNYQSIQSEMILGSNDNNFDCLIVELFHYETSFHCLGNSIKVISDSIDDKSITPLHIYGFA